MISNDQLLVGSQEGGEMSQQSLRAERERFKVCRNCRKWSYFDGCVGRCKIVNNRIIMTTDLYSCDFFVAKKGNK